MTGTDHSAILKQMGITQWMLRDTLVEEGDAVVPAGTDVKTEEVSPVSAPEPVAVQSVPPQRAATQGTAAQPAPITPSEPVPNRTIPDVATVQILVTLRSEVDQCTACKLAESRTRTVFGSGPEQPDWLFVGEAPGQQEDRQGKPFVGRAGSLLTQMLLALGQSREQVFIANALKCRPPGNRDPLPEELQACEPFLLKQVELLKPRVMVALGRISAQALLNSDQPLAKLRGQVYRYGPDNIPLIVTYHPAYLLRNPADKAKVWEDLLLANRQLPG